jgi:hypothetical protein
MAERNLDEERLRRDATPWIVSDGEAFGWQKTKLLPERRYRLMRLGYLRRPMSTKARVATVYDSLRNHDGVKVNNYRIPDEQTLGEIQGIDDQIAELQRRRGLLLAERFMTWPLLTMQIVEAERA